MSQADLVSLVVVLAAATGAVIVSDAFRRFAVPVVVVEILAGVALGPHALGLARPTPLVAGLAALGACFLFFLAGHEVAPSRLRGWPISSGFAGWALSLCLATLCVAAFRVAGLRVAGPYLVLALSTTALGILMPVLRDRGLLDRPLGVAVAAAGVAGWVCPLIALTFLQSAGSAVSTAAGLAAFVAAVAASVVIVTKVRPERPLSLLRSTLESSGQLAVRGAVLLLLLLLLAAALLHVNLLFAAFCAGAVLRTATPPGDWKTLRSRLDAVGFGLLVPTFFITTGMSVNVAVFWHGGAALLAAAFFAAFLLVRGTPALLALRRLGARDAAALGFYASTKLPLLVVIAVAARSSGAMDAETASALIAAATLSVAVFPLIAARLSTERAGTHSPPDSHESLVRDIS